MLTFYNSPKTENNLACKSETSQSNIIQIHVVDGGIVSKSSPRLNKDGSVDRRKCNREVGKSSEVYAFRTKEEISDVMSVLNSDIENAATIWKLQLARRNRLIFILGMNLGIRASDLCALRWSFFFDNKWNFKEYYVLQPKKQRNSGKFVKLYFNDAVKSALTEYLSNYKCTVSDINDLIFTSQKGAAITERYLCQLVKSVAQRANIKQNIGSHSLRKTFGLFVWHEAEDKNKALVLLQQMFGHSSTQTTLRYIGIMDNEISEAYHSLNLGLE